MKQLMILFLSVLLVLSAGCRASSGGAEIHAAPLTFPSVDELTAAVQTERQAKDKDDMAEINELEKLSVLYAPTNEIQGFQLKDIAVNPYYIFYRYIREGEQYYERDSGVTVTVSRSSKKTMSSICGQLGIMPDADGFAYDAGSREMYFTKNDTVIFVQVPEDMNDYDTIRSLCEVEEIKIP